ncbi:MAG TPA: RNA polymerase-binding protein DksA [Steroidobacteraceae bacterium]|nr:RNA polymerase-binding protein DksA [Steroidobacteraceae bacterium]
MPGKKAAKTGKPARKAATRKAPAVRKVARPVRRTRPAAARAKPAKPSRTKPQKAVRPAAAARPAAKPAAAREPAILKSKGAAALAPVAEGRPALGAIPLRPPARRPGSEDEDEGGGGHNLLLGPRNVRPYRERKGEQYMSRDQLDHFRGILSNWKRDLMEEVDRTMSHMKDEAANPPDPNDRATLESEFALELRTRDRERKLIRKIEEALSRIDDGSYGYCIETGEPIGVKRLEARPVATLCIEAQERRERREKQYGDRDDWYR